MNVITITSSSRPDYFRETLESWSEVAGIENCVIIANCERGALKWDTPSGPFAECIALAEGIDFCEREVWVNTGWYGGPTNQWMAMRRASQKGVPWWIIAEEDVIVAPDILDMYLYMQDRYAHEQDVAWMCATAHRFANGPQPPDPKGLYHGVVTTQCWGTWADRWPLLDRHWDFDYRLPEHMEGGGWDWNFYGHVMPVHGVHAIKPSYSRTKHIGVSGNHSTPDIYPRTLTDCFVGDFDVDLSEGWHEMDTDFREQWD
jgi:hypothetical protein